MKRAGVGGKKMKNRKRKEFPTHKARRFHRFLDPRELGATVDTGAFLYLEAIFNFSLLAKQGLFQGEKRQIMVHVILKISSLCSKLLRMGAIQ